MFTVCTDAFRVLRKPWRKPYICIHVFTTQQWPSLWLQKGDNTSSVTSTQWSIYSARQTCCCWPPLHLFLSDLSVWVTTNRHHLWIQYWSCIVKKGSLDILWLSTLHHLWHLQNAGEKTTTTHSFVHFHYGNVQVWVLFCFRLELIICRLNHTLDCLVFGFNFNLLLMYTSTGER